MKSLYLVILVVKFTFLSGCEAKHERLKRSYRNKACELLIVIDEPLFKTYNSKIDVITNLVKDHVDGVNSIYKRSLFKDQYSEYYFRARTIEVLYDFCEDCNHTQKFFLHEFSKYDTSDYCLAVLFTHRDFPQGTQGLAWRNTVCDGRYNTAFITFLNHRVEASKADSIMTLAHEIGHNFGAYHDEDTQCSYMEHMIMGMSGSSLEHPEFSPCSLQDMQARMDTLIGNGRQGCFVTREEDKYLNPSFCGNHKVEEGEECDCGLDYRLCRDPCCYPGHLTNQDRLDNLTARPCHTHTKMICVNPWDTALTYGIILPWIMITSTQGVIVLLWDWRKDKKLFPHLSKSVKIGRTETTVREKVARFERRDQEVVNVPKQSSQSNLVKDQMAKRELINAQQNDGVRNGFRPTPLTVPKAFQGESLQPKPKNTNYPMPKLKSTHTGGYTVVPQRPAPPPPPGWRQS